MKISINRANKLRNALEGQSFMFDMNAILRTDSENSGAELVLAKANLQDNVKKSVDAISHIKTIRDLICAANTFSDINSLISKIAHLERLIKHYKAILNPASAGVYSRSAKGASYQDFLAAVHHRDTLLANDVTKAPIATGVAVDISDDMRVAIEKALKTAKLEVQELQEQRNAKNHSNYVELPVQLVEFLKDAGLLAAA